MYTIVMFIRLLNIAILLFALGAASPALLWADQVYFNSGRKMEARVLSDDGERIELALPRGGTMTLDKSDIKRIQKSDPSEINVNFVDGQNKMMVDCLLDNKVNATFLIDTGASVCMLSKKMGTALGIDMSDPKRIAKVQIADGSSVPAFHTTLSSLRVQHIEAKDVEAVILLQDLPQDVSFKDGLLGMSFLGRYKTHMDYSAKKFVIES